MIEVIRALSAGCTARSKSLPKCSGSFSHEWITQYRTPNSFNNRNSLRKKSGVLCAPVSTGSTPSATAQSLSGIVIGLSTRRCGLSRMVKAAEAVAVRCDSSCRARAFKHCWNGAREDFHVKPERPFIDVFDIHLHPLLERDRIPAVNLPKAGDARTNTEAAPLPIFAEQLIVAHGHGARSDEAHIPLQDVPKLRQLVEAGSSQETADWRNSRIVLDFKYRPGHLIEGE